MSKNHIKILQSLVKKHKKVKKKLNQIIIQYKKRKLKEERNLEFQKT